MTDRPFFGKLASHPVAKALASLRLAIASMGAIAAILAATTIVESQFGPDLARLLVYGRWWFDLVLIVLFLNILFAVIVRLPLRRHQYAFACIHLGMLLLLAGAMATRVGGLDGTLELREGSASMAVRLPETVVRHYVDDALATETPFKRGLNRRSGDLGTLPGIANPAPRILEALPFSRSTRSIVPDPKGGPLVEIALADESPVPQVLRLAVDHPLLPSKQETHSLRVGIEAVDSIEAFFDTASIAPARLSMTCRNGGATLVFALGELVPGTVKRAGSLEVQVLQFLSDATIGDSGLTNRSAELVNPAVRLEVRSGKDSWEEILYGRVPGFRFSGDAHPEVEWSIDFRPAGGASLEPLLRLGAYGDSLYARCEKDGKLLAVFPVVPGRAMPLPFGSIQANVGIWLPKGNLVDSCQEIEPAAGGRLPPPAIRVGNGPWGDPKWLPLGGFFGWEENGRRHILSFEERRVALPFVLRLDSFRMGTDPGTMDAASYESYVTVSDSAGRILRKARIAMNEPLHHAGFALYQAGFSREPEAPASSLLSVNRDPGRPFKYLGALLLVASIAWYAAERVKFRKETGT